MNNTGHTGALHATAAAKQAGRRCNPMQPTDRIQRSSRALLFQIPWSASVTQRKRCGVGLLLALAFCLIVSSAGMAQEGAGAKSSAAAKWRERILNEDGAINWSEYEHVATHAGKVATRDYLVGPKYEYYHPTAEKFPTLELQGGEDGWDGAAEQKAPICLNFKDLTEWYCQSGPLVYVADDPNNAGVIRAANGEFFHYKPLNPPYGFWCRLHWGERGKAEGWYTATVPVELKHYNNPKKPIAVATATGIEAFQMYVAFQNGLIGTFPTLPNAYPRYGLTFPYVQLPEGKVPMALAVTPGGEFVLAAVWDVKNHKGQMAVIAVQGRVRVSEKNYTGWALAGPYESGTFLYGIPGWMTTKAMKLLGFVDLPIAAPLAIKAGTDLGWTYEGRNYKNINYPLDQLLEKQSERDTWFNNDGSKWPNFKGAARSGYAIIASRSENKVVFVDLQPLLTFYRNMYFTTQERYDQTKNVGGAPSQWPYTFEHSPEQKPVVVSELKVAAPTAVAAGFSNGMCADGCMGQCSSDGTISGGGIGAIRPTPFDGQYAYVTTLDGKLLIYMIGGLNTEAPPTTPALVDTVNIGKNPSSLENGNGGLYKNDLYINCRGDKAVYVVQPSGEIVYVLRDSRIVDPVMAEPSVVGRQYVGVPVKCFIHVVDFTGKTVLTYVNKKDFPEPMTFGAPAPVPGHPFAYQQDEVQ